MTASLGHVPNVLTRRDAGPVDVALLDPVVEPRPPIDPDRVRVYQLGRDELGPIWVVLCRWCEIALVFFDHRFAVHVAVRHVESTKHAGDARRRAEEALARADANTRLGAA